MVGLIASLNGLVYIRLFFRAPSDHRDEAEGRGGRAGGCDAKAEASCERCEPFTLLATELTREEVDIEDDELELCCWCEDIAEEMA